MATVHITNATELINIASDLTGDYVLDNDIVLSGSWTPLGPGMLSVSSGTCTSTTSYKVIDSNADFIIGSVQVGDTVWDENNFLSTTVTNVDDLHTLTVAKDYFSSGEAYGVHRSLDGFTGTLNGNGYTIRNLTVGIDNSWRYGEYYRGLFGKTTGATLTNISLSNVLFEWDNGSTYRTVGYIGSLSGHTVNTTVQLCTASGTFNITHEQCLTSSLGGLIGKHELSSANSVEDSWTNIAMNLIGDHSLGDYDGVGGVFGNVEATSVECNLLRCYSTGNIVLTGGSLGECGGIVGGLDIYSGTVSQCYSTGNITIDTVYNNASGSSADDIAGCFGWMIINSTDNTIRNTVSDCYSTGNISITSDQDITYVGGFCGIAYIDTVDGCYATGNITLSSGGFVTCVSGFIGQAYCYYGNEGNKRNITGCYSESNIEITATEYVSNCSGFISSTEFHADYLYIYGCQHEGTIDVTCDRVMLFGGFISGVTFGAYDYNFIQKCYHEGNMSITLGNSLDSSYEIAGFIGNCNAWGNNLIKDCYAKGTFDIAYSKAAADSKSMKKVGGMFGYCYVDEDSFIINVYSEVDINLTASYPEDLFNVGGFAGDFDCYSSSINVGSIGTVNIVNDSGTAQTGSTYGGFAGELYSGATLVNCSYWTSSHPGKAIGNIDTTLEDSGWGTDCPTKISFLNKEYHMYNQERNEYDSQSGKYDFNLGTHTNTSWFPDNILDTYNNAIWEEHLSVYPDFRLEERDTIIDPIATSGCPQCGTFLWNEGIAVDSDATLSGRHRDKKKDRYIRCARCKFVVDTTKHQHAPRGSKLGWGITYTEQY